MSIMKFKKTVSNFDSFFIFEITDRWIDFSVITFLVQS
ncbi:hypothetical protein NCDO763_0504 [Lactococcus cremoris]|nr:hypothetical protein V4_1212 [Lactococcus cremoris]KZK33284.1 hypothetical protein N41_2629 [Lactococcus cremoris]KZK52808.1 hypothetical protein NCDO763_0504 [Lactococcus cremoris]